MKAGEVISQQISRSIVGVPLWLWVVYIIMSVAAILFYISFWPDAPLIVPDSPGYMEVAKDLTDWRLDHSHLRPPGYPVLLVLTGSAHQPTRALFIVSLMLHILSVGLLLAVLVRIRGIGKVGVLIFMTLLLLPPFVDPAAYVMTENLSKFVIVLGTVGLLQWFATHRFMWLILALIGFAYAGITHPIYLFVLPAIALALLPIQYLFPWVHLTWRRIVLTSSVMLSVWLLLYGGFSLKMRGSLGALSSFHPKDILLFLGSAFSSKTLKVLERLPDEYALVRKVLIEERNYDLVHGESHTAASYMNRAQRRVSEITGLQGGDLQKFIGKLNWILIRKAPLHFIHEVLMTMTNFWVPAAGRMASRGSEVLKVLWSLLYSGIFVMLWLQIFVLVGATVLIKRGRFVALQGIPALKEIKIRTLGYVVGWSIIGYVWFISCVLGMGDVRYRQPVETLMVFVCFLGFVMMREVTSHFEAGIRQRGEFGRS